MHENKIGIIIDDLSASQLSYYVIKNINEYLGSDDCDFVIFFENSSTSILQPEVGTMNINEIWGFDGILISTSVSTTLSMINTFAKAKYFYVWDLEWLRGQKRQYKKYSDVYTNP